MPYKPQLKQPLNVGDRVRDGLGHYWRVLAIVTPYIYRCQCETHGACATIARSELRRDGE